MDYTQYIAEAKQATSPAELKEFAATKGLELTDEKAAEVFEKLKTIGDPESGQRMEEELAKIAGGVAPMPTMNIDAYIEKESSQQSSSC